MSYPILYPVHQQFETSAIADAPAAIRAAFAEFDFSSVQKGKNIGITVGSRGIDAIVPMLQTVVIELKKIGLHPFIIPAMGSHGSSTGEGQRQVLEKLKITEDSMDCPIISSVAVRNLGPISHPEHQPDVYVAEDAYQADYIFVMNRVKPHTLFHGEVESGLCKIMAIGLGKAKGADSLHCYPLEHVIRPCAEKILKHLPVLAGLALVENSREKLHSLRLVPPEQFVETDKDFLALSASMLPRIPTNELDILLIDEMGKNISGTGMDTNVIGSWRRVAGKKKPNYRTLIVRRLTPEAEGNAHGIGMADLIPQQLFEQIDTVATYANSVTTGVWASGRIPVTLPSDRACLDAALAKTIGDEKRVVRITNTLCMEKFWASKAVANELEQHASITVDWQSPTSLTFTESEDLI